MPTDKRQNIYSSERSHRRSFEFNIKNIVGGDCDLTTNGVKYAEELAGFIAQQQIQNLRVWTSQMKRTIETAKQFTCPQERWQILNDKNLVSFTIGSSRAITIQKINLLL